MKFLSPGQGITLMSIALLFVSGCASNATLPAEESGLERYNKSMHNFNLGIYKNVLRPVSRGLDFVVPDLIQETVEPVFENLEVPNTAFNNLMQGKAKEAGQDMARFGINTTIGLAGLIDWASVMGLPIHEEDFGQTLAKYGVGAGPYVVLPMVGGVTPRAMLGQVASLDPVYFLSAADRNTLESVELFFGLAEYEEFELPTYEEQKSMFSAARQCSISDGTAQESCRMVCDQMVQMMQGEIEAKPPKEQAEMKAMMKHFMPSYCQGVAVDEVGHEALTDLS